MPRILFVSRAALLAAMVCAAGLSAPSLAASSAAAEANATYQRERAVCIEGRSQQDRATCLKEAAAARDEARRTPASSTADAATLRANARQRCEAVAPADRRACLRMVRGEGSVSGSVEGGGQIKELRTTVPAPAPASGPR